MNTHEVLRMVLDAVSVQQMSPATLFICVYYQLYGVSVI